MRYLILIFPLLAYAVPSILVDRFVLQSEVSTSINCVTLPAAYKTKDACELVDNPPTDVCVDVPIAPCELLEFSGGGNPTLSINYEDLVQNSHDLVPIFPTITSSDFEKIITTADFGTSGQLLQTTGTGPNPQGWTPYTFPTADGTSGQALLTDGAGTLTFTTIAGGFTPGNETWFELGGSSISVGAGIPFFPVAPTRTNIDLGSSADIILRISDDVGQVVNTGIHTVIVGFTSSKNDTFDFEINGVLWEQSTGSSLGRFGLSYSFNAGDTIEFVRTSGAATAAITDITFSIMRVK